jgi:GR25 family glycosyltransferase involved in LPS biosynthesis
MEEMQKKGQLRFIDGVHRLEAVDNADNPGSGCMQSHMKALEMAQERKWSEVLVVEDDVMWPEDVDQRWKAAVADLPDYWFLMFGGATTARNIERVGECLLRLKTSGILTATHCMYYSERAYGPCIALFENEVDDLLPTHIDLLLSMYFAGDVSKPIYLACPFVGYFVEQGSSDVRKGKDTSTDFAQLMETQRNVVRFPRTF